MNLSIIIVAVAENNVIGKDNKLIWKLPADMQFFKDKTIGHCVITGRKNYESIPEKFRPLVGRTNIVITRQKDYKAPGAIIVDSINEAIKTAKKINNSEIFIIGGAEIYKQSLPFVNKIYLTKINSTFDGDVFFPILGDEWKEINRTKGLTDEKNKYDYNFIVYEKFISNEELIRAHDKGTGFCSAMHHMKSVSPTYTEIISKGKEIVPDILKYLRDNDGGMSIMLLLWEILKISPYEPEHIAPGFGGYKVSEARQAWIDWGKKQKLMPAKAKIGDTIITKSGDEFIVKSEETDKDGTQWVYRLSNEEYNELGVDGIFSWDSYGVPDPNFKVKNEI